MVGAAAGFVAYLVLENSIAHTEHSEDGLVLFTLTVPVTAAGALIGLVAGAASRR